jgi:type I site-specific restriction-modification system R (restriction) subunit
VRVVDWEVPAKNDYLVVQQFWVTGELHKRRPELVGFVNGLPPVLVELKAHIKQLENANQHNLRDFPQVVGLEGDTRNAVRAIPNCGQYFVRGCRKPRKTLQTRAIAIRCRMFRNFVEVAP